MSTDTPSTTIEIRTDVPTLVIQVLADANGKPEPQITFVNGLTPFSLKMTLVKTLLQIVEQVITAEYQGERAAQLKMEAVMKQQTRVQKVGGRR